MQSNLKHIRKNEKGFTLVELAIVMIIIGLLITGVLKGQELITNAQITTTISQVKGIDAAFSTFDDKYNALPGDMPNAKDRIPNCTSSNGCVPSGGTQGNRKIDTAPDAAQTGEALVFFVQLSKADLLSGISPELGNVFGGSLPSSKLAGGFHVGHSTGTAGDFQNAEDTTDLRSGHYLVTTSVPVSAISGSSVSLTPNQAQRIDTKLDDGNGDDGNVRAYYSSSANECSNAGIYVEADTAQVCGLYIRIQQ